MNGLISLFEEVRGFIRIFFVLLIISLINGKSFAQLQVGITYNSVITGRNVSVHIKKEISRHSIMFGIKYHVNRTPIDNQSFSYVKRFKATDFIQHFGFNLGYNFNFRLNERKLVPFLFYDFQFTNADIQAHGFIFRSDLNGPHGLVQDDLIQRKTIALDHNIGLGLSIPLTEKIYLYQRIGGGIATFHSFDPKVAFFKENEWEFGYLLGFGLNYVITP